MPKRKWSAVNARGETLEMEDLDEKAVYVFGNVPKKITTVFARYVWREPDFEEPATSVTCSFIFHPSGTSDIGDFTEMNIKNTDVCSNSM